jgi:hypothetical protein
VPKQKIGTDVLDKKPKTKPLEIQGDFWEFAKQVKTQKREEQEEKKLPELPPPAGEKPPEKPVYVTEIQAEALAETLKSGKKEPQPESEEEESEEEEEKKK